jgi:hypothetical protein
MPPKRCRMPVRQAESSAQRRCRAPKLSWEMCVWFLGVWEGKKTTTDGESDRVGIADPYIAVLSFGPLRSNQFN